MKPLKDRKGKTVLNAFMEIINKSNRKPIKLRIDQLMQEWLHNNDILTYSTHNDGKSVVSEIFIKTLKAKIYKSGIANDSKSYLSYLNKLYTIILIIILLVKNY